MGWEKDMDEVQAARAADGGRTPAPWGGIGKFTITAWHDP